MNSEPISHDRPQPPVRLGGAGTVVSLAMALAHALPVSRPKPPRVKRGNKYALCGCGSYEPWANCCGKKAR